jgi:hypothetical protein
MFEATALNRQNDRNQKLARIALALVTLLLVIPVLLIMGMLRGCPGAELELPVR